MVATINRVGLSEIESKELREIFSKDKQSTIQSHKQEKSEMAKKKESQYKSFKTFQSQRKELSRLARNHGCLMQNIQIERGNKSII